MPTECAYELDKRPLISIAVQRHAMLCLVFTGNEFKTRLDVKLQTDALLIYISIYNSYDVILYRSLTQNLLLTVC